MLSVYVFHIIDFYYVRPVNELHEPKTTDYELLAFTIHRKAR